MSWIWWILPKIFDYFKLNVRRKKTHLRQTHSPLAVMQVSPERHWASERHFWVRAPEHPLDGSPDNPAGHLQRNEPMVFSQKAPWPHGDVVDSHSLISMQALWIGKSWNPGKHLHIGILSWTKHCAFGKQVAVSHGFSQFGPILGSGQEHAPAEQIAFPGHWSLLVQATAPPQLLVTGS